MEEDELVHVKGGGAVVNDEVGDASGRELNNVRLECFSSGALTRLTVELCRHPARCEELEDGREPVASERAMKEQLVRVQVEKRFDSEQACPECRAGAVK